MFCTNCGKQIPENSNFCTYCGASTGNIPQPMQNQQQFRQPYQQPFNQYPQKPKKGKGGVVALVAVLIIALIVTGIFVVPRIIDYFKSSPPSGKFASIGFTEQNVSVEAAKIVDNRGGVISLPSDSALAGCYVTVPATAVDQHINVSVGTVTGTYKNAPASISSTALHLDLGGYKDINQPILITFKYADTPAEAEKVPVGLYIDEAGKLHHMLTHSIDKKAGQFTVMTFHASTFTYYILEDMDVYPDSSTTGFMPSKDGFAIVNHGSSLFSGGECYGMSTFAKWYYMNKKTSASDALYNLFKTPQMGVTPKGDAITPQDIIATKAFQYTTKQSSVLYDTERQFSSYVETDEDGKIIKYTADNSVAVRCIMDSLYFWEEPVEVGIYGTAGHSVLAYGYTKTADKITIKIYDPNFPGDNNQKIVYDIATKKISTPAYADGFLDKRLTTTGSGTFTSVNEYEKILIDAKSNFAGTIADLVVIDPYNGDEVEERTYVITGYLDTLGMMGEQIGDAVEIISDEGEIFRQNLSKDGSNASTFSIEVPLKSGENKFLINAIYKDEKGNENFLSHNLYGWLVINCNAAANAIYITLTWDSQPDIDLYVTTPYGETAYWESKITSDGGFLDIDQTYGYGPEHYTLVASDSVAWGQVYTVRLHYFDGDGPTAYKVMVTENEGTKNERTTYYSGVIYTHGFEIDDYYNNYKPGCSGPDWVDICTVVPVRESD